MIAVSKSMGGTNAPINPAMETLAWPYILSVPVFFALTKLVECKKNSRKFDSTKPYTRLYDGACPATMKIRQGAARWPALEVIYNWQPQHHGLVGLSERYWLNMRNAQAVRNRFKIVSGLVRQQAISLLERNGSVRVMSIASGSAQCIFEALKDLPCISILCVDSDPTAIEHSKILATQYGFADVMWHESDAMRPGSICRETGFQPDIVEMVGLIDYLSDTSIVTLCNRIYDVLSPEGMIITGHIHPNPEARFLEVVSDWKMRYRTKKSLISLLERSKFGSCKSFTEPHNIHTVVTSYKL